MAKKEGDRSKILSTFMKKNLPLLSKVLIFFLVLSITLNARAQNQTVAGDLTINGRADVISGPLSVGTASFTDDNSNQTTAEGLTLHYSEVPQIWDLGNYVPGRSTIIQRVAQEKVDFQWQVSVPDTLGGFDPVTLMKLSNETLFVTPSIEGDGTENILPNQTLDGGAASILTKSLADTLYLATSGGTVTGNVTFNGTVNVTTLGNSFTGLGTDYRLTNQIATHVDSIMTRQLSDQRYIKVTDDGHTFVYGPNASAEFSGIAMGYWAKATENAIAIGHHTDGSGERSVAMGYVAFAPGEGAIAIGGAYADHLRSIALNGIAQAAGSVAIGIGSESTRPGQVSIGNYNQFQPLSHSKNLSDYVFVVGNGNGIPEDPQERSNAFTILRNGDTEIKGSLTVVGTDNRLPNQIANQAHSIMTRQATDQRYVPITHDGLSFIYGENALIEFSGIALGQHAAANANAISIGVWAGKTAGMASGAGSISIGYAARAVAPQSIAFGPGTWGGGNDSISIGVEAAGLSEGSVAIGRGARSSRPGQIVLGSYNIVEGLSHSTWEFDNLLVVGNGGSDIQRSNALIVKRNGNMEVYGTSLTVNGVEVLTEAALLTIQATIDDAIEDVNLGTGNYISRSGSIAMTYGSNSTAVAHSIALGEESTASGTLSSSAIGYQAKANQAGTHALGSYLIANRAGQVVVGRYNDYGSTLEGSATETASDAMFVIGNGSGEVDRRNALVVRRNGNIEFSGNALTFNGEALLSQSAAATLYLTHSSASESYLSISAAAAAYQPKPEEGIAFLTSEDLVAIQADIDSKIDATELADALDDLDVSGNYLSKNPSVGLAYGTGSTALAGTSAIGSQSVTNQAGTHAIGSHIIANRPGQVVVGSYNDYGTTQTGSSTANDDDAVFVIGVGNGIPEDEHERKNALEVKRSGDVHVTGGVLRVLPAGNLSMGSYNQGPRPAPLPEPEE